MKPGLLKPLAIVVLTAPAAAGAAEDPSIKDAANALKDLDQAQFVGFFNSFAGWFLAAVGLVAFVVILYAAFLFMSGGFNEDNIKKAKKFLIYGLVGSIILVLSLAIFSFVGSWFS